MNLNRISLFVRVVEARSFSAASRTLDMPTSSVSRAVAKLEAELGVQLLHRTTRQLSLTEAGQHYYDTVRGALGAIDDANACATARSRAPQGTVRVTAPADFNGVYFMQALARFLVQYPSIHIDLLLTNRRVNLVEEGVDLALRAGDLHDSTLVARRLGESELGLYGSTAYLAAHGTPRTLAQLARHDCILFRGATGLARWRFDGPRGTEEVDVRGRITVDSMTATRSAVIAGLGIGLLPTMALPDQPTDAAVVRVLPRLCLRSGAVSLVWPSARFVPRHVVTFREFFVAELGELLGTKAGRSTKGVRSPT